jgi:hypothetical protein
MAKTKKGVKRSGRTSSKKQVSYASDFDLMLIVGGGFVVLILVMLFVLR